MAKKIISFTLALIMVLGMLPAYSANAAEYADRTAVETTAEENDFVLAGDGKAATIWVDNTEELSVKRVADDLKEDIKRVTGLDADVSNGNVRSSVSKVIVGTLDKSAEIKALVEAGSITEEEVAAIKDQWEAYLIKVVDANTLVIAGSDNRGAIYGVYEISEQMGVSPWYYFADVPVQTKTSVVIPAGTVLMDKPDVQYRGLFINDEEKLYQWAQEAGGLDAGQTGTYQFGPEFYSHLFELILRLGGNYFWPAMHMVGFNNYPENIPVVQKYGVVFGTSHCDMLGRTNKHEWNSWCASKGYNLTLADWDYTQHKDKMIEYWTEGVTRHKDSDVQWTVGLRGNSDEPMIATNVENYMVAGETKGDPQSEENAKTRILIDAMKEQYKILETALGEEEAKNAFKVFVPYKEVLPLYNNQIFQDWLKSGEAFEFTTMWCNDNHGMVRNTPNAEERAREGGNALYIHLSYWAPKDQSYMWMSSLPLSVLGEELNKSWETGIQKAWIVNVGDLKPAEGELDYFMQCGWDVDYTTNAIDFSTEWMLKNFGMSVETADETADILNTFYHHSNVRKAEHMKLGVFDQTTYNEWDKKMATSQDLYDRAAAVANTLSDEAKDSFYELVQSKINWTYYTNKMFYYADKSNLAFDQGRMASADTYSQLSIQADNARKAEIAKYSTIVGGKWEGFIDPENYDVGANFAGAPVTTQSPATSPAIILGETEMGVIVQGEDMPKAEASTLTFSRYNQDGKFVDIFNKGAGSFSWTAAGVPSWVTLSKTSGTVNDEERIFVTVNDYDTAAGQTAAITITAGNVTKTVDVTVENVAAGITDCYVEADGYVSMQAEHYTAKTDVGNKTWQLVENAGRGYDGDMMRSYDADLGTVSESDIKGSAPSLSYDFYLTSSGEFDLEVYRLPTLNATGQVRFAVSVDDGEPILVSSTATDEGTSAVQNPQWAENLYHQIEKHVVELPDLATGNHTLKLWMVDNFISIDKLVIYTDDIPKSELGPDESYHSKYNSEFTEGVATLGEGNKAAATEKDLTDSWGSGNFVEMGGKVSIEAEYAMENVLTSGNDVTADMSAYTISHADVQLPEGLEHNAWRFTQSDRGYGVYSPDLGYSWPTSNPDFRTASPELGYRIDFTKTGDYYVWARIRMTDYFSHEFYYSTDTWDNGGWMSNVWSNENNHKWTWCRVGKVTIDSTGTHTYNIWMREDGIAIDRLYFTTSASENPSDDTWTVSLRKNSGAKELFEQNLANKKAEINKYSYPIGTTVGCYSQEKYTALQNAITAADNLVNEESITEEQANNALAAIDTALQELNQSLILTDAEGKNYLFYRDFEADTTGVLFPYGLQPHDISGSGAYEIVKEGDRTYLRLTTGTGTGNAQMIIPYGDFGVAQNQRLVVEFDARLNDCGVADANLWVAMNGTEKPTVTTMVLNNGTSKEVHVKKSGSESQKVGEFVSGEWKSYKVVVDMWQHHYDIYLNGHPVWEKYPYRTDCLDVNKLTGHRFGLNKANGSIDFDNIKVSIETILTDTQTQLVTDLEAKKNEINGYSYPIGSGAGCYGQTEYDALQAKIRDAEDLVNNPELTTEQANAALAAIDTAYAAFKSSLNLTENGKTYLFYRDFANDTADNKLPYGLNKYAVSNGTAEVVEENEEKFLRLSSGTTAGSAQMSIPYAVSDLADQERLVVEFSARIKNMAVDTSAWVAMSSTNMTVTTMLFNIADNGVDVFLKDTSSTDNKGTFAKDAWVDYKIVVNMKTKTYDVYMGENRIAENYSFRDTEATVLTGHRFGINNRANTTIDFDNFKVSIVEDVASVQAKLNSDLTTKKNDINLNYYTVGTFIGNYPQDKYNAVVNAISEAEALANSNDITTAKATEALAKIDAAFEALEAARIMKVELVNEEFNDSTVNTTPTGNFETFAVSGTGSAVIAKDEADGNLYLRLSTGTSAGTARMKLLYSQQPADKQELIISFKTRFVNESLSDVTIWGATNNSSNSVTTMLIDNNNKGRSVVLKCNGGQTSNYLDQKITYNQWHEFQLVVDMKANTYDVWMDGALVEQGYSFRESSSAMTGHLFGINNKANGTVDFDDFKVSIREVQVQE